LNCRGNKEKQYRATKFNLEKKKKKKGWRKEEKTFCPKFEKTIFFVKDEHCVAGKEGGSFNGKSSTLGIDTQDVKALIQSQNIGRTAGKKNLSARCGEVEGGREQPMARENFLGGGHKTYN